MKTICVFCGSSMGQSSAFALAAVKLGRYLAISGITLVYGGSDCGLMGTVANSVLRNGGKVIAVMPKDLLEKCGHTNGAELITVDNMQQRKQKMIDLSDAFIVLPGGFGTLDEIFEILTYRQLGYHNKPCGFLNVRGFFNSLLDFIEDASTYGFINPGHFKMAFSTNEIEKLVNHLEKQLVIQ